MSFENEAHNRLASDILGGGSAAAQFFFDEDKFDSLDSDLGDIMLGTTPPRNHREERRNNGRRHSHKPPKLTIPNKTSTDGGRFRARHSVVRMEGLGAYFDEQFDDKQHFQMRSRKLDKERREHREFKHSAISINTETTTSSTGMFHSLPLQYDPLPSPIPKVDSFTPFLSIKSQQKVSPPSSPSLHQTTSSNNRVKRLSSSSAQKLQCPPDRVEFHQIFSKLIRMGQGSSTKKDQAADTRYAMHAGGGRVWVGWGDNFNVFTVLTDGSG